MGTKSGAEVLGTLTTNLAVVVCVCVDVCQCAKFDQFLPARSHFESKRPENFVRIAKFPYAAFGPLFAFHCPLFFTRNNDLDGNRHTSPQSFAALWQINNWRNPFSRHSSLPRGQRENVVYSGMQRSRFKPRAENNIFFIFIVCD